MLRRALALLGGLLGGLSAVTQASEPLIKQSFTRIFVAPDAFKPTIRAYMAATAGRCSMYFPFPERGLELATVSSPHASFLIIAGQEEALARIRETRLTFQVTDLDAALAAAADRAGATRLQDRTAVPTGVQARVRLPDGLVIEYVEHNEAAHRFYTCQPLGLE